MNRELTAINQNSLIACTARDDGNLEGRQVIAGQGSKRRCASPRAIHLTATFHSVSSHSNFNKDEIEIFFRTYVSVLSFLAAQGQIVLNPLPPEWITFPSADDDIHILPKKQLKGLMRLYNQAIPTEGVFSPHTIIPGFHLICRRTFAYILQCARDYPPDFEKLKN